MEEKQKVLWYFLYSWLIFYQSLGIYKDLTRVLYISLDAVRFLSQDQTLNWLPSANYHRSTEGVTLCCSTEGLTLCCSTEGVTLCCSSERLTLCCSTEGLTLCCSTEGVTLCCSSERLTLCCSTEGVTLCSCTKGLTLCCSTERLSLCCSIEGLTLCCFNLIVILKTLQQMLLKPLLRDKMLKRHRRYWVKLEIRTFLHFAGQLCCLNSYNCLFTEFHMH